MTINTQASAAQAVVKWRTAGVSDTYLRGLANDLHAYVQGVALDVRRDGYFSSMTNRIFNVRYAGFSNQKLRSRRPGLYESMQLGCSLRVTVLETITENGLSGQDLKRKYARWRKKRRGRHFFLIPQLGYMLRTLRQPWHLNAPTRMIWRARLDRAAPAQVNWRRMRSVRRLSDIENLLQFTRRIDDSWLVMPPRPAYRPGPNTEQLPR